MADYIAKRYEPLHHKEYTAVSASAKSRFSALSNPAAVEKLHDEAAISRFMDKLEYRDRPVAFIPMSRARIEELHPGLFMGEKASGAWAKPGSGNYARDAKFVVAVVKGKDGKELPIGIMPAEKFTAVRTVKKYRAGNGKSFHHVRDNAAWDHHTMFKKGVIEYTFRKVAQRYKQYFGGAKDMMSNPTGMGNIFASLGVTSISLSAVLYGMLYMVEYASVQHDIDKQDPGKKQQQQQQMQQLQQDSGTAGPVILA